MELRQVLHVIDGREVASASGRTFTSIDPSNGQPWAEVAFGEAEDVDRAVAAAWRAFDAGVWTGLPPAERSRRMRDVARLIRERAEVLAELEARDSGKPLAFARDDVLGGAGIFDYFSQMPEQVTGKVYASNPGYFIYSRREPYGVVGAIAPWNFPFNLACWKVAPALAVGNSVILKMAEQTPVTTSEFARICLEAGIPAGVVNVVHGDGPVTGAALAAHPRTPKLTFTGSTQVGQSILKAAADHIKSVHLELGGKTANIVFDDADLDQALAGSIFTSYFNSGQICTSGSRLLVARSRADEFLELFAARARAIRVGHPLAAGIQMGPLISAEQHARVLGYIETGQNEGARLLLGGDRPSVPEGDGGYFVNPTIFADVRPDMRIAQEEIFGPVLSVMTFEDEAEALRIANGTLYGLAATLWTRDLSRALRMAQHLDAGIIWTNCPNYLQMNVPYEGHKQSGLGEDLGIESIQTFTKLKVNYVNYGGHRPHWA